MKIDNNKKNNTENDNSHNDNQQEAINSNIMDETMQETIELSILFDFYGELLSDNNKEVFIEYIFNDLSLGEIAQDKGITRQGIHDVIKRSSKKLREYEDSLHLVEKFKTIEDKVNRIKELIEQLSEQEYSQSTKDIPSKEVILGEMNNIVDNILDKL